MSDVEKICIISAVAGGIIIKRRRSRKNRSKWVKQWLSRKDLNHMPLLKELEENEPDDFKNYLRMDQNTFNILFNLLKDKFKKKDTKMRQAILPEERLIATLRFLATGRYYNCLRFSVGIAEQTLGYLIPETCRIMYEVLSKDYLKFPQSKEEWMQKAEQFKNRWEFINCGGALDGKHCRIIRPPQSGATYFNYKGFYSIILMTLVDAEYKFIWLDVGKQGRMSDGGVIAWTQFYKDLENDKLNLPSTEETDLNFEFVFISDEAFTLDKHLLKPYPSKDITDEKRIFNYRLARARNVVENAFGLLSSRFRIFHRPLSMNVENASYIIAATCALHNFLLTESSTYVNSSTFDRVNKRTWQIHPGEWRNENPAEVTPLEIRNRRSNTFEQISRDKYCDFFNGVGQVAWQNEMLKKGKA